MKTNPKPKRTPRKRSTPSLAERLFSAEANLRGEARRFYFASGPALESAAADLRKAAIRYASIAALVDDDGAVP